MKALNIGISIGDINGVGPELILRALRGNQLVKEHRITVYGSSEALKFYDKELFKEGTRFFKTNYIENIKDGILNVIDLENEAVAEPGKVSDSTGQLALAAIEAASNDLVEGKLDLLVTAPLNKSTVKTEEKFTGQTEYLARKAGDADSLMLMTSERLRVALATNHLPLKDVVDSISTQLIFDKLLLLNECLRRDFLIDKPRIAVLGINPHAGDYGLLGMEETDVIAPGVNKARDKGISAFGPFSADGLFGSGQFAQFDAVLAMYHDQGLVPFKAITFSEGVNYTAGLPFVRTSPDHGTAYDLAGKGTADLASFQHALFTGIDICRNRIAYDEMTANPVKKQKLRTE